MVGPPCALLGVDLEDDVVGGEQVSIHEGNKRVDVATVVGHLENDVVPQLRQTARIDLQRHA